MEFIIIARCWNDPGEKYRAACSRIIKGRKKGTPPIPGPLRGATVKSWNEAWSQNPMRLARANFPRA